MGRGVRDQRERRHNVPARESDNARRCGGLTIGHVPSASHVRRTKSHGDSRHGVIAKTWYNCGQAAIQTEEETMADVRVRYAPSPTGRPHVGNIHTALFNWLFARHAGGQFLVRIEDTDQARIVPESLEAIEESLRWLGLDWDEGPVVGGPYGPYFQSERLAIYQQIADELLANGHAYRCYCSEERLAAVRAEQAARHEPPRYDQLCRFLTADERARCEASGQQSVIRLAIPKTGTTSFHDIFRGEITFENALIEDQVLIKSNGWPTYHLANIIDDHLMRITHVLRGDEWISSTPKHILLYQALGWEPPLIGHFSILLGPDKSKLSKRHGAQDILTYRQMGYLSEALLNFLALLGWAPEGKEEILNCSEIIQQFTLEHVGSSPAVFNAEKLDWMNGVYIRQLPIETLVERLIPFLQEAGLIAGGEISSTVRDQLDRIVPLIQERIKRLDEAADLVDFFFQAQIVYDPALLISKGWTCEQTLENLRQSDTRLREVMAAGPFSAERLEPAMRGLASDLNVKAGPLFGALRVAVTGRTVTPPLFQTMDVLGADCVLERVGQAMQLLATGVVVK